MRRLADGLFFALALAAVLITCAVSISGRGPVLIGPWVLAVLLALQSQNRCR